MKNNGVLFWKLERKRFVRLAVSEQDGFSGNRPFFRFYHKCCNKCCNKCCPAGCTEELEKKTSVNYYR